MYLSGVGIVSADQLLGDEQPFLQYLKAHLPRSLVVNDVFPYSVLNTGLTGNRRLHRVWRWVASPVLLQGVAQFFLHRRIECRMVERALVGLERRNSDGWIGVAHNHEEC